MRALTPVATLLAVLATAPPAGAAVLDTVPRPTPVAAGGGVLAWSRYDPAAGSFSLVIRNGGDTAVAPVAPRPRAFDVDLGLDGRGRPVAVYTREGDVYRYDVATGKERRLAGVSSRARESSPTVDAGRVAVVRDGSTVVWRRLGGRGPVRRLRAPQTATDGIDLRGTRLALQGYSRRIGIGIWSLRLDGGRAERVGRVSPEGEAPKAVTDVQVAQGGIRWVAQGSSFGGFEGFRGTRFDGSRRVESRRKASVFSAAFAGSRVLFVRTPVLDEDELTYSGCPADGCLVQTAPAPFR